MLWLPGLTLRRRSADREAAMRKIPLVLQNRPA
jgi:hypothetical protein